MLLAIMAITSAKQVVIPSATNWCSNCYMAIKSANRGNSISHCGNNINHYNYVTFHLSQLIPQSGFIVHKHVSKSSDIKALMAINHMALTSGNNINGKITI